MYHFEHIAMYYWHRYLRPQNSEVTNLNGLKYVEYKDLSDEDPLVWARLILKGVIVS